MAGFPWGAVIGAGANLGGSLLGGLFGNKGQKKQQRFAERSWQWQQTMDVARIRMLVNDAKKAGIHPLAALGVAPGGGGFASPVPSDASGWGDRIGSGLSALGQFGSDMQNRADNRDSDAADRRERALAGLAENTSRNTQAMQAASDHALQTRLVDAQIGEMRANTIARLAEAATRRGTTGVTYPDVTSGKMKNPLPFLDADPSKGRSSNYGDVAGEYGMTIGEIFGVMHYLENWGGTHFGGPAFQSKIPLKVPHRGPQMP